MKPLVLRWRWLLVLLLAFDLASSPFHAHLHEAAGSGLPEAGLSAGLSFETSEIEPFAGETTLPGHLLATLLRVVVERHGDPSDAAVFSGHPTPPMAEPVSRLLLREAEAERPPWRRVGHERPKGRAPPLRQA